MKTMILISALIFSALSFADSTEVRSILYTGAQDTAQVNLSTEKTRTEYRTVRVPSTCYRTEWRRQCHRVPGQCRNVCRHGTCRQQCTPARQQCNQRPVQVPYSCMRTETQSYQVHDYYVETTANFEFSGQDMGADANEKFKLAITGESARLTVKSSKNYMLILDNSDRSESREGGVKYVNLTYRISAVSAHKVNEVLGRGIRNVSLNRGILKFTLGRGFNTSEFSQQVRVMQNRRLGRDTLLLNKTLASSEMDILSTNDGSQIVVDLNSLGVRVPSKVRIILDTTAKVNTDGIINKNDFKFSANANWIFR